MDTNGFLQRRLFSWLDRVLIDNNYDVVLPVERKATAILRAYIDFWPDRRASIDWSSVLSSAALPFLQSNYLDGKRVLVFNEMVHQGKSTQKATENVYANSPGVASIEAAAFAVHHDFNNLQEPITVRTHAAYYNVPDETYRHLRLELIAILRNCGALLLDTEHLELLLDVHMPIRDFIDLLSGLGKPIEYETQQPGMAGLTIMSPVVPGEKAVTSTSPAVITGDTNPRKVRVVRRHQDEYAIIPIWYPSIQLPLKIDSAIADLPPYAKGALDRCPERHQAELLFHVASLIAGLELMRSTVAALGPAIRAQRIKMPLRTGSIDAGSPLGHLRALYPYLDFDLLQVELSRVASEYVDPDETRRVRILRGWSKHGATDGKSLFVDSQTKVDACQKILSRLVLQSERFTLDEDEFSDETVNAPFTFTWREYWEAGARLGIPEHVRSVAMDAAIDNAWLRTAEKVESVDGVNHLVRAYQPDSEFSREELLRIAHGAVPYKREQLSAV